MTQTTQAQLTPTTDQTPAIANATYELSGSQWVARFPGSASTNDLTPAFKAAVDNFIAALKSAGAHVSISATLRPPERAYLMHYCSLIASGGILAPAVPHMQGVNIEWNHGNPHDSKQAAQNMANGYGIAYPPVLVSRHTQKRAIDMTITNVIGKTVLNASGVGVPITSQSVLHSVGATYGVIKLASDPPHWSDDGH